MSTPRLYHAVINGRSCRYPLVWFGRCYMWTNMGRDALSYKPSPRTLLFPVAGSETFDIWDWWDGEKQDIPEF